MDELKLSIQKAQKGDREAYGQIYNLYYKKIYRYCYFNLENRELAQDICQETFLKAWKSLPTFSINSGGTLQAFLFKIAKNLIIDNSRKKKTESIDKHENLETNENFEEDLDRVKDTDNLKRALGKLNEKDRQIIVLKYLEEMSGAEVAKIIGKREGALRVRIHRILANLKKIMEEQ